MGSASADRRRVTRGPFWATAAGIASGDRYAPAAVGAADPAWMQHVKPPPGVALLPRIKLSRYAQRHEVPSSVAADFSGGRGWNPNIFDGVMEGWWESEADMVTAFSTPEGMDIARRLIEDERRFSSDRCMGMITREYLIYDANANTP